MVVVVGINLQNHLQQVKCMQGTHALNTHFCTSAMQCLKLMRAQIMCTQDELYNDLGDEFSSWLEVRRASNCERTLTPCVLALPLCLAAEWKVSQGIMGLDVRHAPRLMCMHKIPDLLD